MYNLVDGAVGRFAVGSVMGGNPRDPGNYHRPTLMARDRMTCWKKHASTSTSPFDSGWRPRLD